MKYFTFLFSLLIISIPMLGREYFVATEGSDSHLGTASSPFASIHKASEIAMPGDTVTIRGGTYDLSKQFKPYRSGLPSQWISYRSADNEVAIFNGERITKIYEKSDSIPFSRVTQGVFQIENQNYLRFERITVANSRAAGFIVRGPMCKKIVLDACKSMGSFNSGIGLWYCDSTLVSRCEITGANDMRNSHQKVDHSKKEGPHEALSVAGATNFELANNHIHHCFKEGIDCKEVSRQGKVHHNIVHDLPRQAYYADAWFGTLEDIEFYSNIAYNCFWGFAISVEGKNSELKNVRIHHNLVYNITGSGVLFGTWGHDLVRSDIHIYNNTFYACGSDSVYSGGVGSIDIHSQNLRNVFIYRNIFDKGWNYEIGSSFDNARVEEALKARNVVIAENLLEGIKERPSEKGQYEIMMYEFLPSANQIGEATYKSVENADFTPISILPVKVMGYAWKYESSPWFGAFESMEMASK